MSKKAMFRNLSMAEMCKYSAGENPVSKVVQWLGAQYHLGYDRYMKSIEKRMNDGTAWRLTD